MMFLPRVCTSVLLAAVSVATLGCGPRPRMRARTSPDGFRCTPAGPLGPMVVADDVYAARHGQHASRWSEVGQSRSRPVEECGFATMKRRLAALTCDDGSVPWQETASTPGVARVGQAGPGGRCGSLIDLYEVTCPEATYSVYADVYFCSSAGAPGFWGQTPRHRDQNSGHSLTIAPSTPPVGSTPPSGPSVAPTR